LPVAFVRAVPTCFHEPLRKRSTATRRDESETPGTIDESCAVKVSCRVDARAPSVTDERAARARVAPARSTAAATSSTP
jgi:hypothetical protein